MRTPRRGHRSHLNAVSGVGNLNAYKKMLVFSVRTLSQKDLLTHAICASKYFTMVGLTSGPRGTDTKKNLSADVSVPRHAGFSLISYSPSFGRCFGAPARRVFLDHLIT